MLNKEKINFNLPIFFVSKTQLTSEIKSDLEMTTSSQPNKKNIYDIVFDSKTPFDKLLTDKWGNYTTHDTKFIKDSQNLYKNINN